MSTILLADAASQPQWWQVVGGIAAIPTALFGLVGAYRLNQKTRLETLKLQKELLQAGETTSTDREATPQRKLLASSRAISIGTQGFIFRFIVFYLAQWVWSEIAGLLITPFVVALSVWNHLGLSTTISQASFAMLALVSQIGSLVIFVVLGLPLLQDIMRYLGLTWRDLYLRRSRPSK